MNTYDIELPPLPPLHIVPSVDPVDYPEVAQALMDYARAAIERYQKRIEELEAELQELRRQWVEHDTLGCPTAKTGIYASEADRQRRGGPVKAPSDEELYELAESMDAVIVCSGEGDYNDNEDSVVNYARAVLARYGQTTLQSQPIPYAGVTVWVGDKRCSRGVTKDELELSNFDILQAAFDLARWLVSERFKAAPKFGEEND